MQTLGVVITHITVLTKFTLLFLQSPNESVTLFNSGLSKTYRVN